jgi:hypothetical protein
MQTLQANPDPASSSQLVAMGPLCGEKGTAGADESGVRIEYPTL